jgi:uncharacterized repeat protein (TIGR03806 family)
VFKKAIKGVFLLIVFTLVYSCKDDDNGYVPLNIQTNLDLVETLQGTATDITIFSNDHNIPENGTLTITNPAHGTASVTENPDLTQTFLTYTPNSEFFGEDSFEYTVCLDANCATATVTITVLPITQVNYNLDAFPYDTLSEYNFFQGTLSNLNPGYGVLPYSLNSALFSDYAKKKRFVWMPSNVSANYVADTEALDFPVGAILIKNFYYENVLPNASTKIIETRLMIKQADEWTFANYVWNEEQTEAHFTTSGSVVNFDWVADDGETKSINYQVPSYGQCFSCHNSYETVLPIGPKPQNLNKNHTYVDGLSNQLEKWKSFNYLAQNTPTNITSTVDWKDDSQPIDLRFRSYVDINCAHCHSEQSFCEYRPLRLAFNETTELINMGICVSPDQLINETLSLIITPGIPSKSAMHFRLSSLEEQYRMPLIGRTLQHEEGVQLLENFINTLNTNCE